MFLSPKPKLNITYTTTEEVIKAIFNGTYSGCYLLSIKDHWKKILGEGCWVHDLQHPPPQEDTKHLKFTVQEFDSIIDAAMETDRNSFAAIITAKRKFDGEILR